MQRVHPVVSETKDSDCFLMNLLSKKINDKTFTFYSY